MGRQVLYKSRPKDDFVAFHAYQKWVEIDCYRLKLEAKAGEKFDGQIETFTENIAYSQKIIAKENQLRIPNTENSVLDGFREIAVGVDYATSIKSVEQDTFTTLTILAIQKIRRH